MNYLTFPPPAAAAFGAYTTAVVVAAVVAWWAAAQAKGAFFSWARWQFRTDKIPLLLTVRSFMGLGPSESFSPFCRDLIEHCVSMCSMSLTRVCLAVRLFVLRSSRLILNYPITTYVLLLFLHLRAYNQRFNVISPQLLPSSSSQAEAFLSVVHTSYNSSQL